MLLMLYPFISSLMLMLLSLFSICSHWSPIFVKVRWFTSAGVDEYGTQLWSKQEYEPESARSFIPIHRLSAAVMFQSGSSALCRIRPIPNRIHL
jgi:hypothetical protein